MTGRVVTDVAGNVCVITMVKDVKPGSFVIGGWRVVAVESKTRESGRFSRLKLDNFEGTAFTGEWVASDSEIMILYETIRVHAAVMDPGKMLPMRVSMLTLDNGAGETIGEVSTQGGMYGDAIVLQWKGTTRIVRGLDLLKEWVGLIDPAGAKKLP